MNYDIIVQTPKGNHTRLAEVENSQIGAVAAGAIYHHYKDHEIPGLRVQYVWIRDISTPDDPHLVEAWPDPGEEPGGAERSLAAWKKSPRGISGNESEPDEATARSIIESTLVRLPARYFPQELTCEKGRFSLRINGGMIFRDRPARAAMRAVTSYVEEHEAAHFSMPTGVVNGIYD